MTIDEDETKFELLTSQAWRHLAWLWATGLRHGHLISGHIWRKTLGTGVRYHGDSILSKPASVIPMLHSNIFARSQQLVVEVAKTINAYLDILFKWDQLLQLMHSRILWACAMSAFLNSDRKSIAFWTTLWHTVSLSSSQLKNDVFVIYRPPRGCQADRTPFDTVRCNLSTALNLWTESRRFTYAMSDWCHFRIKNDLHYRYSFGCEWLTFFPNHWAPGVTRKCRNFVLHRRSAHMRLSAQSQTQKSPSHIAKY